MYGMLGAPWLFQTTLLPPPPPKNTPIKTQKQMGCIWANQTPRGPELSALNANRVSNQKPTFGKLFILSLELSKASKIATSVERCWSRTPAGICTFTRKGKSSETSVAHESNHLKKKNDQRQSQGKLTPQSVLRNRSGSCLSNGPYAAAILG